MEKESGAILRQRKWQEKKIMNRDDTALALNGVRFAFSEAFRLLNRFLYCIFLGECA